MKNKQTVWMLGTGLLVGAIAAVLVKMGNPANMGFCIACFLRDITGALKMHSAAVVQYVRPEIIGLVLGAFLMSLAGKEFQVRGGSSPISRFVLGFFVMVGALMFLGCPLRMVLRLAGGDLNAIIGLVGFIVGIFGGIFFLQKGFSLRKTQPLPLVEGIFMPAVSILLLVLLVGIPSVLMFSTEGPGAAHAPIWIALVAGLVVGALSFKTRLCMVGGIRDGILFRDFYLLSGFVAILVGTLVFNLILGNPISFGMAGQPIAHTDGLWNFLGMALVGVGSVLLGGCPLRQLILAGGGNSDSSVAVVGMIVGAAFCHNFGLASSGAGPTNPGKIAVILGFAVVATIGCLNLPQKSKVRV